MRAAISTGESADSARGSKRRSPTGISGRVPGANVLADVAAKHPAREAAPQPLGNGALVLDRLVGEAEARVHHPRRGKRPRGAALETALARAAQRLMRLVVDVDRAVEKHHRQRQPRAELAVDEQPVLANPTEPGALGPDLLHRHAGVDAGVGPHRGIEVQQGLSQRPHAIAVGVVVVAPAGVAGDARPLARRAAVGDAQRHHRADAGQHALGVQAVLHAAVHPVHVGGVAGLQPGPQRRRVDGLGPGEAHQREAGGAGRRAHPRGLDRARGVHGGPKSPTRSARRHDRFEDRGRFG